MLSIITSSEQETKALACEIGKGLTPPYIFALVGELGSGKTVFAQGLAEGMGITGLITSPTFVLLNQYQGAKGRLLNHMDLYRLEPVHSIQALGFLEGFDPESVWVIEWADRLATLPPGTEVIQFFHVSETTRKVMLAKQFSPLLKDFL